MRKIITTRKHGDVFIVDSKDVLVGLAELAKEIASLRKENEKSMRERFKDMDFVENTIKPLMNEYYKAQSKSTKGELLVLQAQQQLEIEDLKKERDELKVRNRKLDR